MERGSIFLIEPVPGIERQEFDFGSFGQIGWLVDNESPGLHSSLQCHAITVAPHPWLHKGGGRKVAGERAARGQTGANLLVDRTGATNVGRSWSVNAGDPYEAFLPPALRIDGRTSEDDLRAVVFVVSASKKGTSRSGQEYESPLLVLTGTEYAAMPFQVLHDRLCTALRGDRSRLVLEVFGGESTTTLLFEDGSTAPGPPITK